jgi:cell wall-associated NlpC family hydrolase
MGFGNLTMCREMENKIIEIARTWLGTKFHHQGRKKGAGVDCIGLVVGVAQELGLQVEDKTDYGREPNNFELQNGLKAQLKKCELQIGAVALFKMDKEPQHVGIISDYGDGFGLIHAYAQSRKVVEHNLDELWLGRLVSCYFFQSP